MVGDVESEAESKGAVKHIICVRGGGSGLLVLLYIHGNMTICIAPYLCCFSWRTLLVDHKESVPSSRLLYVWSLV